MAGNSSMLRTTRSPPISIPWSGAAVSVTSPVGSPNVSLAFEMSMDAPISERMSRIPVRVGFMPTFATVMRDPGTIAAATKRNAAEEISPGSTPFSGLNVLKGSKAPNDFKDLKGWTRVVRPSSSICAPIARNMRVVWSRTGPGTRNVLTLSAPSAASWRQLNTCADATGNV